MPFCVCGTEIDDNEKVCRVCAKKYPGGDSYYSEKESNAERTLILVNKGTSKDDGWTSGRLARQILKGKKEYDITTTEDDMATTSE